MKSFVLTLWFFFCSIGFSQSEAFHYSNPSVLTHEEFEFFKNSFSKISSDYQRATQVSQLLGRTKISCLQLKILLEVMGSEYQKTELCKAVFPNVLDCSKAFVLESAFESKFQFQQTLEFYTKNCSSSPFSQFSFLSFEEFELFKTNFSKISSDYQKVSQISLLLGHSKISCLQLKTLLEVMGSEYQKTELCKAVFPNVLDCSKAFILESAFESKFQFQQTLEFYTKNCR